MVSLLKCAATIALVAPLVQGQPVFRTGIELVELDVSVVRDGKPVIGLGPADFELRDNGVVQQVQAVALEDVPLGITVALDVSQSLSGRRMQPLITATGLLLDHLQPDDQISLVTFSHEVQRLVPMGKNAGEVRRAAANLQGRGSTALRDALYLSMQLTPRSRARPLLLVFTDGADTASWLSEQDVLGVARRLGTVTHVVETAASPFTRAVAGASGGRTWQVTPGRQIDAQFTAALNEMRARYLISYAPSGVAATGWHQVGVKLRRQRAEINARPGYFVPATGPQ